MAERRERGRTPSPASQRGHVDDKYDGGGKSGRRSRGKEGRGKGGHRQFDPKRPSYAASRRGFEQRSRTQCGNGNGHYGNGNAQLQLPKPRVADGTPLTKRDNSLNHLLNFTVVRRGRDGEGYDGSSLLPTGKQRSRRPAVYNKEQFLQANCQFVVNECGDYSAHLAEPDTLVTWHAVEQVRLFCREVASCPICLQPPRAAKITRCGHVYCWSCILHYLALEEKTWRKCPICYEAVHTHDLKSVVMIRIRQYSINEKITLRLMRREKGSALIQPASAAGQGASVARLDDDAIRFAKLLLASSAEVLSKIVQPEEECLEFQLATLTADEMSEKVYIQLAMESLKARAEKLSAKDSSSDPLITPSSTAEEESATVEVRLSKVSLAPGVSEEAAYAGRPLWSDSEETDDEPLSCEKQTQLSSKGGHEPSSCEKQSQLLPEGGNELSSCEKQIRLLSEDGQELAYKQVLPTPGHLGSDGIDRADTDALTIQDSVSMLQKDDLESGCATTSGLSQQERADKSVSPSVSQQFFFYQADDGQHVYLHPFTARCLVKEHTSLQLSADSITARIVDIDYFSQSEESRKRYRHLSHLPLMCQFALVQLDLRPPLLSRETMDFFADEMYRRRQKRIKKQKEEYREQHKKDKAASNRAPLHSMDQFPLCAEVAQSLPATSPPATDAEPFPLIPSEGSNASALNDTTTLTSPPSFSQALRRWESTPTSASLAPRPIHKKEMDSGAVASVRDSSDEDSYVPSFQEAFSDALARAADSKSGDSSAVSTKKAKRGRKKQVLFSTGMHNFH